MRERCKAKLTLLTLTSLLCIVPPATAGLITYTFTDVPFTDGGTATGHVRVDYITALALAQ